MKRKMYREEVFEDMKSNALWDLKTFYISGPSGIGKSKFAKIWQENKY